MSSDGDYIITYYNAYKYLDQMLKEDISFLLDEYGGETKQLNYYCFYYNKPKYRLHEEDFKKLHADQVLESVNSDFWEIVYSK